MTKIDASGLEDYQLRDVETLINLCRRQDPRGIEQMIADDDSYQDKTVEKVKRREDCQEVTYTDGWSMIYPADPQIREGDTLRVWMGVNHRYGWALNGEVVEWKTEFQRFASRMEMLADIEHRRRAQYDKSKADLEAWITQLHGPYRDRIDRFRAQRPDFDVEGGGYEVYPVLMAQRIQAWCEDNDVEVQAFRDLDHKAQREIVHDGQPDKYGISGHQFDSACGLARAVMEGVTV